MQVTETSADGLKREFTITVPAGDLERRVTRRLGRDRPEVRLPGFRPGKVPMQILRKRFGPSVRGEVLQSTLQDSSAEAISERNLRPALPPKVDIVSAAEGADLEYRWPSSCCPRSRSRISPTSPSSGSSSKCRIRMSTAQSSVSPSSSANPKWSNVLLRLGDIIVVDVEGRVGENDIAGAGGKDRQIMLGAGGSIPGFEDQLIGATAGEHRTVQVTFPEDYAAADFAGKDGLFTSM